TLFVNLGISAVNNQSYEEGEQCARRGMELLRVTEAHGLMAQAMSVLANALRYKGDLEGALRVIRESKELLKKASFPTESERKCALYAVLMREGRLLGEVDGINLGRCAEAVAALQQALDITEEFASKDPSDIASRGRVATVVRELGAVLIDRDPVRAMAVYDIGLRRLHEMPTSVKSRRDEVRLLANSSFALRRLHRNA